MSDPNESSPSRGAVTARQLAALWETLGLDDARAPTILAPRVRLVSLRAPTMAAPAAVVEAPGGVSALPLFAFGATDAADFTLGPRLGEGGMGVVVAATQRSLGREVAVKRLKPSSTGAEAQAALILEARIAGALEHPNVVPVHALGRDEAGAPVIVMKRIEGMPWSALMRARRASGEDGQATELQILMQVCNAIRFAHSRGIVHRDLKPDNVMVGPFGEVYVLDWGIAVSTHPDDPRGLPSAGADSTPVGTPAYMAPEMLALGGSVTEQTDVYLLGAILHEILTGSPPHDGTTLRAVLTSVLASAPFAYDASIVPRELAAVCLRAMARDPADRFDGPEALRAAVAEHLEHRASLTLAGEGAARLVQLETLLTQAVGDRAERRRAVYELFTECRFGFEQALRTWGGNDDAQRGLQRALAVMVGFELDEGDPRAAQLHAAALQGDLHAALRARVAALAERHAAEGAELTRLRALEGDHDADAGNRSRVAFLVAVGGTWATMPFALALLERAGVLHTDRFGHAVVAPSFFVASLALGGWLTRRSFLRAAVNRRFLACFLLMGVAMLHNRVLTLLVRNGALADAILHDVAGMALLLGAMTLTLDRRFASSAVACAVLACACAFLPGYAPEMLGLSVMTCCALLAPAWLQAQRAKAGAPAP